MQLYSCWVYRSSILKTHFSGKLRMSGHGAPQGAEGTGWPARRGHLRCLRIPGGPERKPEPRCRAEGPRWELLLSPRSPSGTVTWTPAPPLTLSLALWGMRAVLGAAVFKASARRDLQQDWREGSAALSSVPVASPDVPLGPSRGAELGPEGDTQTHPPPPLRRPSAPLFPEPAPALRAPRA